MLNESFSNLKTVINTSLNTQLHRIETFDINHQFDDLRRQIWLLCKYMWHLKVSTVFSNTKTFLNFAIDYTQYFQHLSFKNLLFMNRDLNKIRAKRQIYESSHVELVKRWIKLEEDLERLLRTSKFEKTNLLETS